MALEAFQLETLLKIARRPLEGEPCDGHRQAWTDGPESVSGLLEAFQEAVIAARGLTGYSPNPEPRIYVLAAGNGNDGVSRCAARYAVRTDDPYTAVRAYLIDDMAADKRDWAADALLVDGEAEYGVTATLLNPPDDVDAGVTSIEEFDSDENVIGADGAWRIVEAFPVAEGDLWQYQCCHTVYGSLEEAFSPEALALAKKV